LQLFSYVVARDYGFAPNPFFNVCTLATCKPGIRGKAQIGDWVIGTGTALRKCRSYLVFGMVVEEVLTFDQYWSDPRFLTKRPNLRGSKKQAFGDNIYYHASPEAPWQQLNSHHSLADGSPNPANIKNDTQADRVLIGTDFVYWGGSGPRIPKKFREYGGVDICARRGYKCKFPDGMVSEFVEWLRSMDVRGYAGAPIDWDKTA
jgi:hypothetical protein